MGVSVKPFIVIGVHASALVSLQTEYEEYEVHDKRGKPTGVMNKEAIKTIRGFVGGNAKTEPVDDNVCLDSIATFLGIEEDPYDEEFGIFITDYDGDPIDDSIVGIKIAELEDCMYGGGSIEVSGGKIEKTTEEVKKLLKEKFGLEAFVNTHLVCNVG